MIRRLRSKSSRTPDFGWHDLYDLDFPHVQFLQLLVMLWWKMQQFPSDGPWSVWGQWPYLYWTLRFILLLLLLEYDQQDILLLQWNPDTVASVIYRRFLIKLPGLPPCEYDQCSLVCCVVSWLWEKCLPFLFQCLFDFYLCLYHCDD